MSDDFNNREWTPAQEAQARQNAAALNASLTKASGFGEGGANRLAFEKIGGDLQKQFESQGLLKNPKTDSATIKSQFGSLGEEPSVAISNSAGDSKKSVEFPIDESKITVPTNISEAFKGAADKFGSLLSNTNNATAGSDLGKTLGGMFNSASTTMSSVIGGVGTGLTSAMGSIKDTLTAAAKNSASLTKIESPEQKFAFKSNPFASLEDQAASFKAYSSKLEADIAPQAEQLKSQLGDLTKGASASLTSAFNQTSGAIGNAVGGLANTAKSIAGSLSGALKGSTSAGSLSSLGDNLKSRLPNLSTISDKIPTIPGNSTSSASLADVIKQSTGAIGGALNNVSNSVSADVLAAKQSRAQLFPADALESKLKAVGENLKPSVATIKEQIGKSLPEGLQSPSTGNIAIDEDLVNKDVARLRAQDPTLTDAEARDQARRAQQLNNSLTRSFGFQQGGANRTALEQTSANLGKQFNIQPGGG